MAWIPGALVAILSAFTFFLMDAYFLAPRNPWNAILSFQAMWKPLEKDPAVPTRITRAPPMEQAGDVPIEACQDALSGANSCCCIKTEGF